MAFVSYGFVLVRVRVRSASRREFEVRRQHQQERTRTQALRSDGKKKKVLFAALVSPITRISASGAESRAITESAQQYRAEVMRVPQDGGPGDATERPKAYKFPNYKQNPHFSVQSRLLLISNRLHGGVFVVV